MKFAKGQKVTVTFVAGKTWTARGEIVHGFIVKEYAQPDHVHYTVKVGDELYEAEENELS